MELDASLEFSNAEQLIIFCLCRTSRRQQIVIVSHTLGDLKGHLSERAERIHPLLMCHDSISHTMRVVFCDSLERAGDKGSDNMGVYLLSQPIIREVVMPTQLY